MQPGTQTDPSTTLLRPFSPNNADRNGWMLMHELPSGCSPDLVALYLLEPYKGKRRIVLPALSDFAGPWLIDGQEVVPLAWRREAPTSTDADPDMSWFDEDTNVPFWTLVPFEVRRVCYSQAEGGCWADVGEPAELPECLPEIYATEAEATAASHRMGRILDAMNREEGLRDLSSVLATFRYRATVRPGLPRADTIPTYE